MVECSEKARKEEHFRGNEEDYAVSEAFLDGRCVVSLECSLADNVASSLVYGQGC